VARSGAEVYVVRHGETLWSTSGQHTGTTDIPLTDEGIRQADLLGKRLAGHEFVRVLTSPLGRARETCRLAGLGAGALVREDLREWDYGEYEGLTSPQIREGNPDWDLWRDGCPGGEQPEQVGERVDRVIAELRAADGDSAVFAHGHVLRVLAARWMRLGPQEGAHLGLSTATLGILGHEHAHSVTWLWNDDSHLRVGGA
jgi:broad specificity phosphatase PhoE